MIMVILLSENHQGQLMIPNCPLDPLVYWHRLMEDFHNDDVEEDERHCMAVIMNVVLMVKMIGIIQCNVFLKEQIFLE